MPSSIAPAPRLAPLLARLAPIWLVVLVVLPASPTIRAQSTWSDPRVAATALEQARRLMAEGRRDDAMKAVDVALAGSPRDAALRFTRAVLLADAGRLPEAMQGFLELTQEFPELPEPHNNLATLHASRGELDEARAALDNAVRALPAYALAWENLGDVHLRLAERAYARAASLDKASAAPAKLKLARELILQVSPAAAQPATVNLPGKRP